MDAKGSNIIIETDDTRYLGNQNIVLVQSFDNFE